MLQYIKENRLKNELNLELNSSRRIPITIMYISMHAQLLILYVRQILFRQNNQIRLKYLSFNAKLINVHFR
jgi:hypothetical protein